MKIEDCDLKIFFQEVIVDVEQMRVFRCGYVSLTFIHQGGEANAIPVIEYKALSLLVEVF